VRPHPIPPGVAHQQPKRGRLWLADGSCIRLRPEQRNHVWSYDFVEDRTHDGRKYRILRGIPAHIRSDNGPEFVAKAVQEWIAVVGAKTAYIEWGSPWENGYIESFNARLRDELLNGEVFYTLREAQIVIESWRRHYKRASQHPSVYVIEENRHC
jgi:putative transposase